MYKTTSENARKKAETLNWAETDDDGFSLFIFRLFHQIEIVKIHIQNVRSRTIRTNERMNGMTDDWAGAGVDRMMEEWVGV